MSIFIPIAVGSGVSAMALQYIYSYYSNEDTSENNNKEAEITNVDTPSIEVNDIISMEEINSVTCPELKKRKPIVKDEIKEKIEEIKITNIPKIEYTKTSNIVPLVPAKNKKKKRKRNRYRT